MVKKKLTYLFFLFLICFFIKNAFSNTNIDQWEDSEYSYKDLIENGFEVKGYDISTIKTNNDLFFLLFVTVLQKNNEVYECQEYQTLSDTLETLDLSIVCRKLIQPYQSGVGT